MCLLNRKSHRALGQFIVYNGNVHRFRALPGHAVAKVVVVLSPAAAGVWYLEWVSLRSPVPLVNLKVKK